VLKAATSQVIMRSQQCESKASVQGEVAPLQANSVLDDGYELAAVGDGRCYFNLEAGNSQVIAASQM
jgi:uncharacterized protein YegP (UPF0339 family)